MPRYHMRGGVHVPFTPEEETQRDAEEAAFEAEAPARAEAKAKQDFETDVDMPSLEDRVDALLEGGGKLAEIKAKVDAVKIKHGRN